MRAWAIFVLTAALASLLASALSEDNIVNSQYPTRSTILSHSVAPYPNASITNHSRRRTEDRTVLGFLTPWNPKGKELVEAYRGKIDIVCPAWHHVEVLSSSSSVYYEIKGGPNEDDLAWQKRLQSEVAGSGRTLPAVKVVPRFTLETWSPENLAEMLGSEELTQNLADEIMGVVDTNGYDGVVFEATAVWALAPIVKTLRQRLQDQGRVLVVVLPPLRDKSLNEADNDEVDKMNQIAMASLATLSTLADYAVIMTYDHSGLSGRALTDVIDEKLLHPKSPLRKGGIRVPGPNTPFRWLEENTERVLNLLQDDSKFSAAGMPEAGDLFGSSSEYADSRGAARATPLMGMAFYGYSFPIGWFRLDSDSEAGLAKIPPGSPLSTKDNDVELQASYRAKAEASEKGLTPAIRLQAEPFRHADLLEKLKERKSLLRRDEASGELFFDYIGPLPDSHQPSEEELTEQQKAAAREGQDAPPKPKTPKYQSYWRAYLPTYRTVAERLDVLKPYPQAGIAIWEIGAAAGIENGTASWLLEAL